MTTTSPLHHLHQQADASFLTYAASSPSEQGESSHSACVVETFGELEGEYAAIRKGCAVIDMPQRGTIRVTGADRIDFLNRMITQELANFETFQVRQSFWLSRKGRIDADMRLVALEEETLIDLDALTSAHAVQTLTEFVFSEDVAFDDASDQLHRLTLHGPTSLKLLADCSKPNDGPTIESLENERATTITIAGTRVIAARDDETADLGVHLFIETDTVESVYEKLLDVGLDATPDGSTAPGAFRLRPAGWHAYNIARIEAGMPLFNIDFASGNLPAETGLLENRVSFTKGCYLGQEVVARMKSLGHPKQTLVALRIDAPDDPAAQPFTGAAITLPNDESASHIGAVTSSTRSPMLGDAVIAFAQIKWDCAKPDTELHVASTSGLLPARVQASLRFWPRNES